MSQPQPALRDWPLFCARLSSAERFLLLSDYDGTLVPIRPRPEQAWLGSSMRRLLRRISRGNRFRLGIVSGRALSQVRDRVGLRGVIYVGNHGLEIRGPGRNFIHPTAKRTAPALKRIAAELQSALRGIGGVQVESKRFSLSVHWRRVAKRDVKRFRSAVAVVLSPWKKRRRVRITEGKRVIEVRPPVAWHKGSALLWLMRRYRYKRGCVLYMGDDRTDEDAFRSANRQGGLSVFVGSPDQPTAARWRLRDSAEVKRFLAKVIELA